MTSHSVDAHLLSLAHGLAAGLLSLAAFYVVGLLLLPRRWQSSWRWPDRIVFGLLTYVLLCWIATTSRNIPIANVILVLAGLLLVVAVLRFRWVRAAAGAPHQNAQLRQWVVDFSILYGLAYVVVLPPAGDAFLTLPPTGGLDLVTYARYAKHLLMFGAPQVDLSTVGDLHSPASAYLLAWHSLPFVGDPLDAAVPVLFMLAALFGTMVVELARGTFGLSWRAAIAIAAVGVCAPVFRWTLATYSLAELFSATAVLYLVCALARALATRSVGVPIVVGIAAGSTLLYFATWGSIGVAGSIASGIAEVVRHFSLLALFGLPDRIPLAEGASDAIRPAAFLILPLVPVFWAAAGSAVGRVPGLARIETPAADRQLARALIVYMAVAVIIGNVAVEAISVPAPMRWPGTWRQLEQLEGMPFRTLILKVADRPNGLSTALSMYYMPGRRAQVFGRGVRPDQLPFDDVSQYQPMFIHNFGCEGVGHGDTVTVQSVGCLLMAPPSMTVGTSYPFNRSFLFLHFDRMSARDPGGRWNTEPTLNLRMTADPQRARLDREMYLNFLVNPFLPAGVKPQRLVLRWGTSRRGEVLVGERQWFSLPVTSHDWKGNRLWTVPVAIDFPDGRTILFHEVALTDTPRGNVPAVMVETRP